MSLPRRTRPPPRSGERERRDPRAERTTPAEEVSTSTPVARSRRDPRAERGPVTTTGENRRIDRARPLRFVEEISAPERIAPETSAAPQSIIINHPDCWILAVPDLTEGRLSAQDRDVLGAARRFADAHAGAVIVAAFADSAELGAAGADRVVAFENCSGTEQRISAVRAVIESCQPRHIIFPDRPGAGADIGRRMAAILGEMPATQVQTIQPERVVSRGDGNRTDYHRPPPRLLLIAPEAADPVTGVSYEARRLEPPVYELPQTRIVDQGLLPTDSAAVPLAEAELIASAGNGVTDWPAFHALAVALAASEGGSRPVCDTGALTRDRQIGASGTLVSARGYLALGISGAPQHLQGITECEHVIAINRDAHAEIMKRADLAVVADVQQLMPVLTELLNRRDGQ